MRTSLLVLVLHCLAAAATVPSTSFCADTCSDAHDGICQDPYVDRDADAICELGTDCADCGPLQLCVDCAPTCKVAVLKRSHNPKTWCTASKFSDGICDPECNIWECGHDGGDCGYEEATMACRPLMQLVKGISTFPGNLTTLGFVGYAEIQDESYDDDEEHDDDDDFGDELEFRQPAQVELNVHAMQPLALELSTGTNAWSLRVEMTVSLRWRDARLHLSPCSRQLGRMLSFDATTSAAERLQADADRQLLWTPPLALNGTPLTFQPDTATKASGESKNELSRASFVGAPPGRRREWMHPQAAPADGAEQCVGCMALNYTVGWSVAFKPRLRFEDFPFDRQEWRLSFDVGDDAQLFSCEQLLAGDADGEGGPPANTGLLGRLNYLGQLSQLLPSNGEWTFQDVARPVRSEHPLHQYFDQGELVETWPIVSKCDLILLVQRNPFGPLMQTLLPTGVCTHPGEPRACAAYAPPTRRLRAASSSP